MRRHLHPAAWWVWALGVAAGASLTTNPVLLGFALAVIVLVVTARRDQSPWARAFRFYAILGAIIVAWRVLLHVLVGLKFGHLTVLPLPEVTLPSWAAGIQLGGTIYLEGLLAATLEGVRLATMIVAVGGANALASPKRLLKVFPAALHEVGAALVVAVTVAPQMAASVQRVLRARALRGDSSRGLRAVRQVAMPVLQDTLDRSLLLAAAMDGRGYGRRPDGGGGRIPGLLTLLGLLGACVGIYGILDTGSPGAIGFPLLIAAAAVCAVGLLLAGRRVPVTTYRRDPWLTPEWLTALCGLAALAGVIATLRTDPVALSMPVAPRLGIPAVPLWPLLGFLAAALPAFFTPLPPIATRRIVRDEVTV